MNLFLHILSFVLFLTFSHANVVHLNSSNWKQIFQNNWFIEFYAPWCPACRQFSPIWEELSNDKHLNTNIGAIDVTESPVLCFVFFVKQLPTLYHLKNGIVRQYEGSRNINELREYLSDEKYESQTPFPCMQVLVRFMDFGLVITNFHESIINAGYPSWMSFVAIGCGTIFVGLSIGLILVLLFDCFIPPRPQVMRLFRKTENYSGDLDRELPTSTQELEVDQDTNALDVQPLVDVDLDEDNDKDEIDEEDRDDDFVEIRKRFPDRDSKTKS